MPDVVERLKRDFQDPDYRHVYDEGFLNSSLATQIKVLREERQWTQERLATEAKMNQSRVSEMEDVNFNSWTIRTLRKFTKAFDLRLKISFEEFGTLLDDFPKLNRVALSRRSFKDDPAFKEPAVREPEPEGILAEAAVSNRGLLDLLDPAALADAPYLPQGNAGLAGLSWLGNSQDVANQIAARGRVVNRVIVAEPKAPPVAGVMVAQTGPPQPVVFIDAKTELADREQKPMGQEKCKLIEEAA